MGGLKVSGLNTPIMGCSRSHRERYEYVEDHLNLMGEAVERIYPGYIRRIDRLAARLMGSPPKASLLSLSIAMHDVGKALEAYQRSLRANCTAPLHELASAAITLMVRLPQEAGYERLVASLAIALHHHAMRTLHSLIERVDEVAKFASESDFTATRRYIDNYLSVASQMCGVRLSLASELNLDSFKLALKQVKSYLRKLQSTVTLNGALRTQCVRLYALATVIVGPLIVSDIVSARVNREGINLDEALSVTRDPLLSDVVRWSSLGKHVRASLEGLFQHGHIGSDTRL